MRINLMSGGQADVTWDQWTALARSTDEAGLEGLFRSDHYLSVDAYGFPFPPTPVRLDMLEDLTLVALLGEIARRRPS